MTDTLTRRDPLASTGALTTAERATLARLPDWLSGLLEERVLALLLISESPGITGEMIS